MGKTTKIVLISCVAVLLAAVIALSVVLSVVLANDYTEPAPLPTNRQILHAKNEFYAFFHFGINTYTDREWGTGQEEPSDFELQNADTDQWIETMKNTGMTAAIMVAKHHDGFALWPSKVSPSSVADSAYAGDEGEAGKGNVVLEVYRSCKKYGLKFGFYLSPWDMNYFDAYPDKLTSEDYNNFYIAQLKEINRFLSDEPEYNPADVFEVWFDGAIAEEYNGIIEYDWDRITQTVREFWPDACTAIAPPNRDVAWVGNENGLADGNSSSNKPVREGDASYPGETYFVKSECDVSIRDGWFYHDDQEPKSVEQLMNIYLNSVGKNCTLLLNVPPNREGKIADKDVARLQEFKAAIDALYANPIQEDAKLNVLDAENGVLEYSFEPQTVKYLVLSENFATYGERIGKLSVYVKKDGEWSKCAETKVVGSKWIFKINRETDGLKVVVEKSHGAPCINYVGIFG